MTPQPADAASARQARCGANPLASLVELDVERFREAVGRREIALRHRLAMHPLLSLDALAELADALPAAAIECHAAEQPLLMPGGAEDLYEPPSETVRNIEGSKRWMVLWNIEQVGEYRCLLDGTLDEALRCLPTREGAMGRREAFIFLSAPESVTPVHFDPEHNFLLQIRGFKTVHTGRFPDRASELRELHRYYEGGHRNLEAIPPKSSDFAMQPGDGVYLYPWVPHWVCNGAAVSVSLSVTFRTRRSERFERVHMFNRKLRRYGIAAPPPGEFESLDRLRSTSIACVEWVHRRGRAAKGARDFSH
ncbi:MAG: JmjC domain-containing protein [Gammaproteobacteria bacterium]